MAVVLIEVDKVERTSIKGYELHTKIKNALLLFIMAYVGFTVASQFISGLAFLEKPMFIIFTISMAFIIGVQLPIWVRTTDMEQGLKDREQKLFDAYKSYYERTSVYHGSYPNWKALQEFRELINSFETEIPEFQEYHFTALDAYLMKLHEEAEKIRKEVDGFVDVRLESEVRQKEANGTGS